MRYRYLIAFGASMALAVVFIVAGVGKLMGQSAFLLTVSTYVLSPQFAAMLATWLPWLELVVGLCLLVGVIPQIVSGVSILLIASFILHNAWMIVNGFGHEPCGCLGLMERIFGGNMSTTTSLYVDIGLLVLALAVYFCYPGRLSNVRPWFLRWREIVERPTE
jgi:uncharacterized membrane protein YphA (DoxX/SURF4 family)